MRSRTGGPSALPVNLTTSKNRSCWCRVTQAMTVVRTNQTRDHLFKDCDKWKTSCKHAVGAGQEGDGTRKAEMARGRLVGRRWCSPALLGFLRSTYVGKVAPPAEENYGGEGSEADPEKLRNEGRGGRESF